MTTTGLLLAAGGGTRMGRPKALVEDWLAGSVAALAECDDAVVVLGADAEEARSLLQAFDVTVLVNRDWEDGMGSSLVLGLAHLLHGEADRCLVTLVDLPDVRAEVVGRLLALPEEAGVLARACYHGTPGHPVLIGRDHWAGVIDLADGDHGARPYLATHRAETVECGDLASGRDVDSRPTGDQPAAE